jgi:hypothetical protein
MDFIPITDFFSFFFSDIIDNRELFSQTAKKDYTGFRPMGTKAGEYRIQHEDYENSVFEFYDVRPTFCPGFFSTGGSMLQEPNTKVETHTLLSQFHRSVLSLPGNVQHAKIQKLPQEAGMLCHFFHRRRFFYRGHG